MDRYLTKKSAGSAWWELPAVGFGLLMAAAGITAFVEDFSGQLDFTTLLAWLVAMALAALPIYFSGRRMLLRRLARKFAQRLDWKIAESIPYADLDRVAGETGAAEKLRKLIGSGYLQSLALDDQNKCLRLASRTAAAREPEPEQPVDMGVEDAGYNELLQRMRDLNVEIADQPMSKRIDRLQAVTASIFRTLEAKPDKAKDARRFLNYYLPTIFKLLETYNLLEDQSYQGENIRASRRQIEEILEKLISGVEQLQDKLFSAEALDVEAEIRVMETMLAADGLSGEGTLRAAGRH